MGGTSKWTGMVVLIKMELQQRQLLSAVCQAECFIHTIIRPCEEITSLV